ncbi:hypothetical protein Tsubulata_006630 [Turnera subulata]|uniref:50S ribosomal protein L35 n=1 Tax=Turnera subulata TaxID=218843 RepID=A0A9Q0FDE1_9ROSI|nr:hypothetical protein Tsubulata_006630 [Turnera subulata]
MQRLCSKLRSLSSISASSRPLLHHRPLHSASASTKWRSRLITPLLGPSSSTLSPVQFPSVPVLSSSRLTSQFPINASVVDEMPHYEKLETPCCVAYASSFVLVHVRHVSSRERGKKRKPMTPVTSKLKKIKMKSYSSYKSRFRTMNDGSIRRWREGKNHNAHLKSKKSRRRLRQPSTVPAAYAKVMKKLNFCG